MKIVNFIAVVVVLAACGQAKKETPAAILLSKANVDDKSYALYNYDAQSRLVAITEYSELFGTGVTIKDSIVYNEKGDPTEFIRYKEDDTTVNKFKYGSAGITCDDSIKIKINEQQYLVQMPLGDEDFNFEYDKAGNLQKAVGKSFAMEYSNDDKNGFFKNCTTPKWFLKWLAYNVHSGVDLNFESTTNNCIAIKRINKNDSTLNLTLTYERKFDEKGYPISGENEFTRKNYKYEYISNNK
ncbi:hypothetical protein ACI6Q2_21675 [Chitinophagaceae bacterium LWZ2-11]